MEYALRVINEKRIKWTVRNVLILVLMEYALRVFGLTRLPDGVYSLNPCSNGICSKSVLEGVNQTGSRVVLILVLMEYALRERQSISMKQLERGLNPCSNGICSKR